MAVVFDRITFLLILFAAIEELFKFAIIFRSVTATAFLRPALLVGAGFALTEICLAYSKNAGALSTELFLLLAGIGALHLITSLIGGFSAFSYKKSGRFMVPLAGFFLALILHLIYNIAIIKLINN